MCYFDFLLLCGHLHHTVLSVYTVLSQQLLILEMFIITLVTRLLYRRQYDPLPEEEQGDNEKMVALEVSA